MDILSKATPSVDVGQRLRQLREERDVSMRELARRSGLSANALSMIERGLTSPSVSTLTKLATALEVPITAFFRHDMGRKAVVFRKADARSKVTLPNGVWEGLGSEAFSGRMETFSLTLDPGSKSGPYGLIHSGYEFIFCLRGSLEYDVDHQAYALEPGDSLIFTANLAHSWHNTGETACTLLVVLSGFEGDERPSEFHAGALLKKG